MMIRPETPSDYTAIRDMIEKSFGRRAEATLIERLRELPDFDPALSFVAANDDKILGHIVFSPIVIETASNSWPALALAPLGVHPDYQNRGIGSGLILAGLGHARAKGHAIVVVLGESGYYSRFGFQRASQFGVRPPFEVPDEAFMLLELGNAALHGVGGTVRYSKPFKEV